MSDSNVYAIVGRGYAAALNYATLRLTNYGRTRLGNREVAFIGEPDPWKGLYGHRMGQSATLLSLPGFMRHPKGDYFLQSSEFADITQAHYDAFVGKVRYESQVVTSIRHDEEGGFQLGTSSGDVIRAANVDICTGPGRTDSDPLEIPEADHRSLSLHGRLCSGQDFLRKDLVPPSRALVCIVGSGPVGAVCCERALENGTNQVLWVGIDDFVAAFPPGGRFGELAVRGPTGVVPIPSSLRIASHYKAKLLRVEDGKPSVALTATGDGLGQCWDAAGNRMELSSVTCDYLVVAVGLTNRIDDLFDRPAWDVLESSVLNIPIGLQAHDGSVRVLGAAALNHSHFRAQVGANTTPRMKALLQSYIGSLSNHIQVPTSYPNLSVPVAARFIAEANHYFSEYALHRGPNWNCAFAPNIEACLGACGISPSLEQLAELFEKRKNTVLGAPPDFAVDHGGIIYSEHLASDYSGATAPGR